MQQRQLGNIRITRIVESIGTDFQPLTFFPETGPEDWEAHRNWMLPRAMDTASGNLVLVFQAFLVQTSHHTIIVDTCVGDNKPREARPSWHLQQLGTFLPLLADAGVAPEGGGLRAVHAHALRTTSAGTHSYATAAGSPRSPMRSTSLRAASWMPGKSCTARPRSRT